MKCTAVLAEETMAELDAVARRQLSMLDRLKSDEEPFASARSPRSMPSYIGGSTLTTL